MTWMPQRSRRDAPLHGHNKGVPVLGGSILAIDGLHCGFPRNLICAWLVLVNSFLSSIMSSDEEDYMSMVIEEPKQKETFTQRKKREQREVSFELPRSFFGPH
jgi:hypothetical protein